MEPPRMVDILIVEDNPHDADLTVRALKKRNLLNPVHVVEDGAEAIDFIFCRGLYADRDAIGPPKVIFLDLKLPKVSGLEVLKMIKSDDRTRTIPVVVVTSSREDPDVTIAYNLGANSYVVKPVQFETFSSVMSNLGLYWMVVNHPAANWKSHG